MAASTSLRKPFTRSSLQVRALVSVASEVVVLCPVRTPAPPALFRHRFTPLAG
jgi:hypothetical protein